MGDRAVCWQVWEHDEGKNRYLFLYESGGMDTFTREDAGRALQPTGRVCPSVASYIGQHIGDLMRDVQAGRFARQLPQQGMVADDGGGRPHSVRHRRARRARSASRSATTSRTAANSPMPAPS